MISVNLNCDNIGSARIIEEAHRIASERKYIHQFGQFWPELEGFEVEKVIEAVNPSKVVYCLNRIQNSRTISSWLVEFAGGSGVGCIDIVARSSGNGRVDADLMGSDPDAIKSVLDSIDGYLADKRMKFSDNRVPVMFSAWGPDGMQTFTRKIACPSWNDVKENYICANSINHLIVMDAPDQVGKLIFWHGLPGTGKTYAIRALLREWSAKAQFTYILDPEVFFEEARYMVEVIMRSAENLEDEDEDYEHLLSRSRTRKNRESLMVLIVEDGLQILLEESRKSQAGAMGRLLNLTEGILGQGLRVLVLVTSNEQITKIDPAYLRAGRCLQSLEFPVFSMPMAEAWCASNGIAIPPTGERTFGENAIWKREMTLSDLYAIKNGQRAKIEQIRDIVKVEGFTVGQ